MYAVVALPFEVMKNAGKPPGPYDDTILGVFVLVCWFALMFLPRGDSRESGK